MSPHQQLADQLRVLLAAWTSLPDGFTVERVYTAEHYVGGWEDDAAGRICVLVSAIDNTKNGRGEDSDDITIAFVWLQKLAGITNDIVDEADEACEAMRQYLRTIPTITLTGLGRMASRLNLGMPTPYSAEHLRQNEIFAAVVSAQYRLFRTVAA